MARLSCIAVFTAAMLGACAAHADIPPSVAAMITPENVRRCFTMAMENFKANLGIGDAVLPEGISCSIAENIGNIGTITFFNPPRLGLDWPDRIEGAVQFHIQETPGSVSYTEIPTLDGARERNDIDAAPKYMRAALREAARIVYNIKPPLPPSGHRLLTLLPGL